MTAQPAWQLPITHGLPSASGCRAMTFSIKTASALRDVLDGLTGHRFGQEADEVAGMTGFHRHADFAVGLEAADSRPVTRTRIDHDKRPTLVINLHSLGRSNAYQRVVDRLAQAFCRRRSI